MATRGSRKGNTNFEKMKKEMTSKKQMAKKQIDVEIPVTNIENLTQEKSLNKNEAIQGQQDILLNLNEKVVADEKVVKNKKTDKIKNENKEEIVQILPKANKDVDKVSYKAEEEDLVAETKKTDMVIFRIEDEEFALEISNVKEIIRLPLMTKVPNASDFITGLCCLRGELLPVIDSRKLFGIAASDYEEGTRIVIIEINGKKVGIIADKVSEVLSVDESVIKEPPESIKEIDGGVITSILLLNDGKRIIMVLDASKLSKLENNCQEYINQNQIQNISDNASNKLSQEEEQFIISSIGEEEYAFSVNDVNEIIRIPEIVKVPNTPDYVAGVISIRNQLLAVINLGTLLNVDSNQLNEYSRIVIVDNGNYKFGVIVDKVSQVIRTRKDSLSNQIANLSKMEYIKGFLELNNGTRLVMLLNTFNLITAEDVNSFLSIDSSKEIMNSTLTVNDETESNLEHVVVFKLGDNEFGIRIKYVKEINRISDIVHFPGAPAFIDGMVNLRGEVIPVLNLKTMFNDESSSSESSKFLVVEFNHRRIGIMIDYATEVLKLPNNILEKVSAILDGNGIDKCVDSIAKLNEGKRVVLLLDLSFVLSFM
ncbi:chemotaxis protein CheW [Ruminiclostridium herbifermentans]|uniref:Chemotaxis protein CheW n=1 Tax=Ruminiclostridium herbifermentans TaxID=2488810 RepID=A0A4U7JJD0_9FIRM|nr:chemotaxis protein CheW [Ruminiclostridium herbifermentans]QNU66125.1 chemotaxis protein CheW [Ruminiclostridium herbifermentans]